MSCFYRQLVASIVFVSACAIGWCTGCSSDNQQDFPWNSDASDDGSNSDSGGKTDTGSSRHDKDASAVEDVGSALPPLDAGDSSIFAEGGSKEVCDGVDNDLNGIIDDVDEGGDGICDCLNIATIGTIGPHSTGGNIFRAWLNERSSIPVTELGDKVLTDDLLKPFQVIVALHVATTPIGEIVPAHHRYSDDEVAVMDRWIKNKVGLMTTIGYTGDEAAEIENINRLLAPSSLAYDADELNLTGFITKWEKHALSESVSNIFTDNGVSPIAAGTIIARDASDRIALTAVEHGKGKVAVWGDEWITYDSEWKKTEQQQVERFWINVLKWLSPDIECQVPPPPPK